MFLYSFLLKHILEHFRLNIHIFYDWNVQERKTVHQTRTITNTSLFLSHSITTQSRIRAVGTVRTRMHLLIQHTHQYTHKRYHQAPSTSDIPCAENSARIPADTCQKISPRERIDKI